MRTNKRAKLYKKLNYLSPPLGTLLAITITYITYIGYAVMMGGCALREASGNVTEYLQSMDPEWVANNTDALLYTDCASREGDDRCLFGMLWSPQVRNLQSRKIRL